MQFGKFGKLIGALALCAVATLVQAQSGDPIKIGVPMPLTGPLAGAGRLILAGAHMATDEVNARGGLLGRPVKPGPGLRLCGRLRQHSRFRHAAGHQTPGTHLRASRVFGRQA